MNARLPTIDDNEIKITIRKRYNNVIHNGEVTNYFKDEKCTFYAMRMEKTRKSIKDNSTDTDTWIETEI